MKTSLGLAVGLAAGALVVAGCSSEPVASSDLPAPTITHNTQVPGGGGDALGNLTELPAMPDLKLPEGIPTSLPNLDIMPTDSNITAADAEAYASCAKEYGTLVASKLTSTDFTVNQVNEWADAALSSVNSVENGDIKKGLAQCQAAVAALGG